MKGLNIFNQPSVYYQEVVPYNAELGALWFNTATDELKVYKGNYVWVSPGCEAGPPQEFVLHAPDDNKQGQSLNRQPPVYFVEAFPGLAEDGALWIKPSTFKLSYFFSGSWREAKCAIIT